MSDRDILSNFLEEMRADRKSKTFQEMAQRLMIERDIRNILLAFKEKGFIIQENLDESIGFDFLIRKDNKEALMVLKYQRKLSLPRGILLDFHRTLIRNSLSEGIIVIWALAPRYPSVYVSALELNKMLAQERKTFNFSKRTQPLKDCIMLEFGKPDALVSELRPREKARALADDKIIVSEIFRKTISRMFEDLKSRKYRLAFKKKGAETFSRRDLRKFLT
jgi:hypothetical protein